MSPVFVAASVFLLALLAAVLIGVFARRGRRPRRAVRRTAGLGAAVAGRPKEGVASEAQAREAEGKEGAGVGWLECTLGPLIGQRFDIRPEGLYIGREHTLSQVVVDDDRISKRHVWVGPRGGRVAAVDQGSTNGTFLNVPGSQRITEVLLNPGDTVILSEFDVARFKFEKR